MIAEWSTDKANFALGNLLEENQNKRDSEYRNHAEN